MNDQDVARINELYHKSKTPEGLTPEEKMEQAELRGAYLAAIRRNIGAQLETIVIKEPDGTLREVKKKKVKKVNRGH